MRPKADFLQKIDKMLQPLFEEGGYELVDSTFYRTENGWTLRFLVDRVGGVTIDECVKLSKEVRHLIEVEDIPHIQAYNYYLEVSSPGLNRPLTKETDFVKFCGQKVKVKTLSSVLSSDPSRKNFQGELVACDKGKITLRLEGQGDVTISLEDVDKAHLVYGR